MNVPANTNQVGGIRYRVQAKGLQLKGEDGRDLANDELSIACSAHHGVVNLLHYTSAETDEDRDRLTRLNQLADIVGCDQAIKETYGDDSGFTKYVTDESRCGFLDLLPINPDCTLLEIGAGLGQFTPIFAKKSRYVAATEVVEEQAEFALKRCIEAGCSNVSVAASGDTCLLPFEDCTFDGVIINLVLEWCGMRDEKQDREASQRLMLSEIHRVLKPGGFAFIATKNRYALRYIMGKTDGHAYKMRFGNALPRWMMNGLLRMRGKRQPKGLLHSHGAFVQMIQQAGFERVDPYWAVPDMRHPEVYISANPTAIRAARRAGSFHQAESRLTRFLMPLIPARFVKYFAYGNVAVAFKGDSRD